MSRLDQKLVELALAPSRSKAQELIRLGQVEVFKDRWQTALKPSELTNTNQIRLSSENCLRYVSRGGLKLEGALQDFKIDVKGLKFLDVGLSTGGFSDCLLQQGARAGVGIDVGHSQLNPKLKNSLKYFDHLSAQQASTHSEILNEAPFDLIVCDVSFTSCLKVVPHLLRLLTLDSKILVLVKPQFELTKKDLNKKGIVKDHRLYENLKFKMERAFEDFGFTNLRYVPSRIKGQDGNQEFFLYATFSGGLRHSS